MYSTNLQFFFVSEKWVSFGLLNALIVLFMALALTETCEAPVQGIACSLAGLMVMQNIMIMFQGLSSKNFYVPCLTSCSVVCNFLISLVFALPSKKGFSK